MSQNQENINTENRIDLGGFKSDTRILMGNGNYKNICDIVIGDKIINKDGNPINVINIFNNGKQSVVKIRTNNWHDDTILKSNSKYWIGDLSTSSDAVIKSGGKAKLLDKLSKTKPKSSKYKWKYFDEILNKKKVMLLMPRNIYWSISENFSIDLADYCRLGEISEDKIKTSNQKTIEFTRYLYSCYDLGYIFGTFLGDGNARSFTFKNSERGSTHWSFGIHETDIADKLSKCIKNLLNYDCNISIKDGKVLSVNCYNKCISKVLMKFNKKINKHLPLNYYCSNKNYIQGIYDGLIDSDGNREICRNENNIICCLTNTSKYILELFYWCCLNLGISFSSCKHKKSIGNLKGTKFENLQQAYRIKTHTFNRFTNNFLYSEIFEKEKLNDEIEVWDIEVDCPTNSFIANNSIVHSYV